MGSILLTCLSFEVYLPFTPHLPGEGSPHVKEQFVESCFRSWLSSWYELSNPVNSNQLVDSVQVLLLSQLLVGKSMISFALGSPRGR